MTVAAVGVGIEGILPLASSALTSTPTASTTAFALVGASGGVGALTGLVTGAIQGGYNWLADRLWGPEIDPTSYNKGYDQGVKDTWATATAQATKPKPSPTPKAHANPKAILGLRAKPTSKAIPAPRRTYTQAQTFNSYNPYTRSNYSYTSTFYHYTNPIYDHEDFSASNGYYERSNGRTHMS